MAQYSHPLFQSRRGAGVGGDAHDLPYEREREAAREKAAAEAAEIFNYCPVCGRLVCDRCFLICEDLDLCIACAKALQVRGDVVAGEVSDPRRAPAESAGRISKNRR